MYWKRNSNFIVACILSFAYVIVTLLNIIGPLHISPAGHVKPINALALISVLYFICSLLITWLTYYYLREKPQILFFTLIILGISIIISENFLWANYGL